MVALQIMSAAIIKQICYQIPGKAVHTYMPILHSQLMVNLVLYTPVHCVASTLAGDCR